MIQQLKERFPFYLQGGVVGAIVILVVGFAVGPLTTTKAAEERAQAAAYERDAAYCVAHATRMVEAGLHELPTNTSERTRLVQAAFSDLIPDQRTPLAVRQMCRSMLDAQLANLTVSN